MVPKTLLLGLALLGLQACSPCQAVAMDAEVALSSALTVYLSASGGQQDYCSAVAVGPRTVYTAHHCLTRWDNKWAKVQSHGDGVWHRLSLEAPRCSLTSVKSHLHAVADTTEVSDIDGTCELTLDKDAPDFKHWAPPCMGDWQPGESGTIVHSLNSDMTTACLEGRGDGLVWSSCSDGSLRPGSSGSGLIVNGCVVGVLLVVEEDYILYGDRYFFSALKPPAKPDEVPAVTVASAKP